MSDITPNPQGENESEQLQSDWTKKISETDGIVLFHTEEGRMLPSVAVNWSIAYNPNVPVDPSDGIFGRVTAAVRNELLKKPGADEEALKKSMLADGVRLLDFACTHTFSKRVNKKRTYFVDVEGENQFLMLRAHKNKDRFSQHSITTTPRYTSYPSTVRVVRPDRIVSFYLHFPGSGDCVTTEIIDSDHPGAKPAEVLVSKRPVDALRQRYLWEKLVAPLLTTDGIASRESLEQ